MKSRENKWQLAFDTLKRAINEDATAIERLVVDDDSCCPARELRRERAATLRYVLALAETMESWEWE